MKKIALFMLFVSVIPAGSAVSVVKPVVAPRKEAVPVQTPAVAAPVETSTAPAVTPAAEVKPAPPLVALHKISKEELGKEVKCAVTGKKLKVAENTPAVDYKGKTYYFSFAPLVDQFTKNPEEIQAVRPDPS